MIIILLAVNLLPAGIPQNRPTGHQSFAFPYRIDVGKNADGSHAENTYTSIDDNGSLESAQVLVLEHDPPHDLATHNWSQNRLWPENQYYGAILYRTAAALDGFFYSNLGCRVSDPRLRLLGEAHWGEDNSFISKKGGKLVFSDSDLLNNGAIGYQSNLVSALFGGWSIAHGILLGAVLAVGLSLATRGQAWVLPVIITTGVAAIILQSVQTVDIRISDRRAIWPHSGGVAGIGAEVTPETGIQTVARAGRAKILGIGRDAFARHMGEKVVVMEGGAKLKIAGTVYEALDLPMGKAEGIIDAIPIRAVGSSQLGNPRVLVNGTILLGTNSARANSALIHDCGN